MLELNLRDVGLHQTERRCGHVVAECLIDAGHVARQRLNGVEVLLLRQQQPRRTSTSIKASQSKSVDILAWSARPAKKYILYFCVR